MRVDVWSDVICPWCYLGKRRFERALAAFPHRDEVEVVHRSFQLDPTRAAGTTPRREMLMTKYRLTDAQLQEMDARMVRAAAADGLEYNLEGGVTGNTADAHRLLQMAAERGVQDAVLERFYRAYFTEQQSVFDRESLIRLAGDAGLNDADARLALEDERYAALVRADGEQARALGATGVPFFVMAGRFGVSGAQSIEVFANTLEQAWNDTHGAPA